MNSIIARSNCAWHTATLHLTLTDHAEFITVDTVEMFDDDATADEDAEEEVVVVEEQEEEDGCSLRPLWIHSLRGVLLARC